MFLFVCLVYIRRKKFVVFVVVVSFLKTLSLHAYRREVERLAGWCSEKDLELTVSKPKDMVFDLRKKETPLVPLTIAGVVVEKVKAFTFLGTTISCDLKWDENISQESPPATFLPETVEEIQSQLFHTDSVLPRCN